MNESMSECYKFFVPKKGIRRYFTLPVKGLLITLVLIIAAIHKMPGIAQELSCGIPLMAVVFEICHASMNSYGMISNDRKRLLFARTSGKMKAVLKKALLCDNIRRFILLAVSSIAAAIVQVIFANTALSSAVIFAVFTFFVQYTLAALGNYVILRVSSMIAAIIVFYAVFIISGGLSAAVILMSEGLSIISAAFAAIVATAVNAVCFIKTYNRAVRCYYD